MSTLDIIPENVRVRGFKMIALAAVLYLGLRLASVHRFFADDAEGVGALLQIIGTLYSVVYAFAIYVIWGQFAAVENEILKESGAAQGSCCVQQTVEGCRARSHSAGGENLCSRRR